MLEPSFATPPEPSSRRSRALRFVLGVLVGAAVAAAGLPWVLYLWALSTVGPLPGPPRSGPPLSPQELTCIWTQAKEEGPPRLEPLNPWTYFLIPLRTERPSSGSRLAALVARTHLAQSLRPVEQYEHHIRSAALTIWLTRKWTLDELARWADERSVHLGKLPVRQRSGQPLGCGPSS